MMISKFDAIYKKEWSGVSPFSHEATLVPLCDALAAKINSDWKHSWHWPDPNKDWDGYIAAVSESLNAEMGYAKKRLADLEWAKRRLSELEKTQ